MFILFLLFGCAGIVGQIVLSALHGAIRSRDFSLKGEASLLLFPFYGFIAFIFPLIVHQVNHFAFWQRGLVYMFCFYVFQFFIGLLLSRFNLLPWEYPKRWSINQLVSLTSAPTFFMSGLVVEWIYPWLKALSELASNS